MGRYIIVDAEGAIVNAVEWDGISTWSPPEGSDAVEQAEYEIGGTLIDTVYTPPAP
jgi:hypothetical protein